MVAPVIEWWAGDGSEEYSSYSYGVVDSGAVATANTFNIWNDKGGAAGSNPATNCEFEVKDAYGANSGDVVTEKWTEISCTSYGDTDYTSVGGTTSKDVGSQVGVDSIPSNEAAICSIRVRVPSSATAGVRNFKFRLDYSYI